MKGTAGQIEWAERIKPRVNAEFDRVAKALRATACNKGEQVHTQAVIAILEEKRAEVMANDEAGHFIHDWQDLARQMIGRDSRYREMRARKPARR